MSQAKSRAANSRRESTRSPTSRSSTPRRHTMRSWMRASIKTRTRTQTFQLTRGCRRLRPRRFWMNATSRSCIIKSCHKTCSGSCRSNWTAASRRIARRRSRGRTLNSWRCRSQPSLTQSSHSPRTSQRATPRCSWASPRTPSTCIALDSTSASSALWPRAARKWTIATTNKGPRCFCAANKRALTPWNPHQAGRTGSLNTFNQPIAAWWSTRRNLERSRSARGWAKNRFPKCHSTTIST